MDYDTVITFISSVGFPIVAFYLMYTQNTKILENVRDSLDKTTDTVEKLSILLTNLYKRDNND